MFIATLCTIARTWKQPRCPSTYEWIKKLWYLSVQFSSSNFLWPHGLQHTGLPCPSQLLELAQTHVHWTVDAIQPSYPLSSPSPTFNLSHHQGLFQWVSSSHQVAQVLELQLQHQSSKGYSGLVSFRMDWFALLAVQGTLKSLLQHHSQKHQFFGAQFSLWFNSHISHVVPIHSGIVLFHKKECIWLSSNEVDEPRAYYTEWSKSEKQVSYINAYIWNPQRWYW